MRIKRRKEEGKREEEVNEENEMIKDRNKRQEIIVKYEVKWKRRR